MTSQFESFSLRLPGNEAVVLGMSNKMFSPDGFFAVGRTTFIAACELSLNAAAVLLVLARGSGPDNKTTRWSAEAASSRLGMRWSSAKAAIQQLATSHLVTKGAGSTRPSYKLKAAGDLIWLPNAIVDGAADELSPLGRLRQAQDVMTLRLFVELYSRQNLREDGGVSLGVIHRSYTRTRVDERGANVVWQFEQDNTFVSWTDITLPHQRKDLTADEQKAGKNSAVDFFPRLQTLADLGLIEWVPTLFDGPDGEPIHPLMPDSAIEIEQSLYRAAWMAALHLLPEWKVEELGNSLIAPLPRHMRHVELKGIARLRYRPHTALTSAWWANLNQTSERHFERYAAIVEGT